MKGRTNNPNGRPKGVPNKVTSSLRAFIRCVLDDNREQIVSDLQAVAPRDRLLFLEKLLQYVIPKQQAQTVDVSCISDDQLAAVIEEITKSLGYED